MKPVRVPIKAIGLGLHIATGGLLTALFNPRPNSQTPGNRHTRAIRWWHRRLCRILGIRIHVRGTPIGGSAVLVSNHVSWLDIPVLASISPTGFLSKSEIRQWPVIGWMAATAGTLFIHRGAHQTETVCEALSERLSGGHLITLFPEGTTTDGRSVGHFFPRLLAVAVECGYHVQPIAIRYFRGAELDRVAPFIDDESFPSHLRRILAEGATDVEVIFCRPLEPPHADRRELARQAHFAVLDALSTLTPKRLSVNDDLTGQVEPGR